MSNTILTPTAVTKKALAILHQKSFFIRSINRQYDSSFAQSGAKIGDTLKIRLPNEYTVSTGSVMQVQDTSEISVSLQVATQKHVDVAFTDLDLTLSLDDFGERILDPAMSVLAAAIEADALTMVKDVASIIDDDTNAFTFSTAAKAKQRLDEQLCPPDKRTLLMCPTHNTKYMIDTKGLFTPAGKLGTQYGEGNVQDALGFNVMSTTHLSTQATGTAAKTTGYTVNGATESGATITVQTGTTTFLKGDVVTFAGANAVHPETKADLGYLKQFTVTANSGASAVSLAISPSLTATGARQNVTGFPTNTGAVVKVAAGASELYTQSLAYNKNAFAIVFADLQMPKNQHFAAREVLDGISMRVWSSADQLNDRFPTRIDVLYGFKAIRPVLATRVHADG